jgi:hypothetical protein
MDHSKFELHHTIMNAIKDYLSKNNYVDTLRTLEVIPTQKESKLLTTLNNSNLLKFFEQGEKDLFFSAWRPMILESPSSLKVEVLLQIYFYTFHISSDHRQLHSEDLKKFFQANNEFISSQEDLFPYFALPFISNPSSHSNFQHLFTADWQFEVQSQALSLVQPRSSSPSILENVFKPSLPLQSPKSGRILTKVGSSPKIGSFFPEMSFNPIGESGDFMHFNYTLICTDLCTLVSETSLCALLQALRWKLSQSSQEEASRYLEAFIKNNLLCTTKPHDVLIDRLLASSKRVQEFTVKLMNVMSFSKPGREYLLTKENIVASLFRILISEKSKSSLRTYTLSLMQKLSLSKSAQLQMISQNMVKWIIKVMRKEISAVDEEMIEFCSGILMNLSVRSSAKLKFEEVKNEVIPTIIKYLNYKNDLVVKYTFCLLYTLMGYKTFREIAKKSGIEKVLKGLRKTYGNNEIKAILDQVQSENDADSSLVSDIEAEDIIVTDDDLDDIITDPRVMKGNELLRSRYSHKIQQPEKLAEEVFSSRDKIPRTPYN